MKSNVKKMNNQIKAFELMQKIEKKTEQLPQMDYVVKKEPETTTQTPAAAPTTFEYKTT